VRTRGGLEASFIDRCAEATDAEVILTGNAADPLTGSTSCGDMIVAIVQRLSVGMIDEAMAAGDVHPLRPG
jgi:hypothetical protein